MSFIQRVHTFKTTWEAPFKRILARSTEFLAHMNTLLIWQAWCRHNTHRNVCLGHIKWRVKEVSSSLKSKQKNYTIVCLHIQLPSTREQNKKKNLPCCRLAWVLHLFLLGFKLRFRIIFNLSQVMLEGSVCKWSWRSQKCQSWIKDYFTNRAWESSIRDN